MKRLERKINFLINIIELGTLTRKEAFQDIRELKAELDEMFEPGSDKYQTLLYLLIDAHNLADELI